MKNSIILVAVAAFVTCSVSLAKADSDSSFEPRSVTVKFADLDTASTQGAAALYRRLRSASASVCRNLEPGKDLARVWAYSECLRMALSNAIVKVNRPAVTAYASAHGMPKGDSSIRIADNK
jgi:UrcA family protein